MKLIVESWRKFLKEEEGKKKIAYSGVMLDKPSIEKLIKVFEKYKPDNFVKKAKAYDLPHHMTIVPSELGQYANDYPVGKEIKLKVIGYGISEDAMAIKVKPPFPVKNNIPHITFALPVGGVPVKSNDIKQWTELDEKDQFDVSGNVEEMPENIKNYKE